MASKDPNANRGPGFKHGNRVAAKGKGVSRARRPRCIQHDCAQCIQVASLVREIHQVMKRGTATEDHGLIGNLMCILDHACRRFDPKPL